MKSRVASTVHMVSSGMIKVVRFVAASNLESHSYERAAEQASLVSVPH